MQQIIVDTLKDLGFRLMGVSEEVIRDMEGGEMIIDNAVNFPEFVKHEIFF